jgi:hypothetical protein
MQGEALGTWQYLFFIKMLSIYLKVHVRLSAAAHTYNPNYVRGRDQEDGGLSTAQAKKFVRIPSQPIKSWVWWCMPVILHMGSLNTRMVVQALQAYTQDHIPKITKAKRPGGVAQVVQHLPSKYKALSLNPSTGENKQTKKTVTAR